GPPSSTETRKTAKTSPPSKTSSPPISSATQNTPRARTTSCAGSRLATGSADRPVTPPTYGSSIAREPFSTPTPEPNQQPSSSLKLAQSTTPSARNSAATGRSA